MKLYEHDGKTYEIIEINGDEIIESPTKPGPGWVQVTPEILETLQCIQKSTKRRNEILKKLIEEIEEECKEELSIRRNLGEDI